MGLCPGRGRGRPQTVGRPERLSGRPGASRTRAGGRLCILVAGDLPVHPQAAQRGNPVLSQADRPVFSVAPVAGDRARCLLRHSLDRRPATVAVLRRLARLHGTHRSLGCQCRHRDHDDHLGAGHGRDRVAGRDPGGSKRSSGTGRSPGARRHADPADLRLPGAGHAALRDRSDIGGDRDHHLCRAAGHPAHEPRYPPGFPRGDRGGEVIRQHRPAAIVQGPASAGATGHHDGRQPDRDDGARHGGVRSPHRRWRAGLRDLGCHAPLADWPVPGRRAGGGVAGDGARPHRICTESK